MVHQLSPTPATTQAANKAILGACGQSDWEVAKADLLELMDETDDRLHIWFGKMWPEYLDKDVLQPEELNELRRLVGIPRTSFSDDAILKEATYLIALSTEGIGKVSSPVSREEHRELATELLRCLHQLSDLFSNLSWRKDYFLEKWSPMKRVDLREFRRQVDQWVECLEQHCEVVQDEENEVNPWDWVSRCHFVNSAAALCDHLNPEFRPDTRNGEGAFLLERVCLVLSPPVRQEHVAGSDVCFADAVEDFVFEWQLASRGLRRFVERLLRDWNSRTF